MVQVFIKDIPKLQSLDEEVIIKGWLFNKRSSGKIHFLQVRDGTGFIQVIVEKGNVKDNVFQSCNELTLESSIIIEGKAKKDDRAPSGFEMDLTDLKVIQLAHEYPIQKKEHGIEFLLDNRHLWLRSPKQWAIQRIRNTIINSIFEYLNSQGFIKIDSPILTPTACEGTTTLFPVPYIPSWKDEGKGDAIKVFVPNSKTESNDKPFAFLTQSGQLYLEAAIFAHRRVFDFGPTFRAEKSKTRRHLTEFWMMDAEAAFVEHRENMKIQEELTVAIVKNVLDKNTKELEMLKRNIKSLENSAQGKYTIITHKEAIKITNKLGSKVSERDDFGAEDETILPKEFDRPIFIEKYPKEVKAFYMKEDANDKSRVLNDDMLAPEGYGEIIGGSQREDDYDKLLKRIKEEKLPVKDFEWYLDLRKYGSVPHSGFGIGLERYVTWICGLKHIRTTIPFPRMINRLRP
ncbi:asparagine--tRNA ligase [Candidatus Dojkabacteria bacterium]|nr:asparagine--tRNA ligase [Candidatus Dojkabacteria bacterium]